MDAQPVGAVTQIQGRAEGEEVVIVREVLVETPPDRTKIDERLAQYEQGAVVNQVDGMVGQVSSIAEFLHGGDYAVDNAAFGREVKDRTRLIFEDDANRNAAERAQLDIGWVVFCPRHREYTVTGLKVAGHAVVRQLTLHTATVAVGNEHENTFHPPRRSDEQGREFAGLSVDHIGSEVGIVYEAVVILPWPLDLAFPLDNLNPGKRLGRERWLTGPEQGNAKGVLAGIGMLEDEGMLKTALDDEHSVLEDAPFRTELKRQRRNPHTRNAADPIGLARGKTGR